MTHESSFPDRLSTDLYGYRGQSEVLILTHYFRYCNPNHPIITVPTGALTDGASIPRPLWSILSPRGPYGRAAVIHDYLYSPQSCQSYPGITRRMADEIFRDAILDCGCSRRLAWTMWAAVRLCGWKPYKGAEKPIKNV